MRSAPARPGFGDYELEKPLLAPRWPNKGLPNTRSRSGAGGWRAAMILTSHDWVMGELFCSLHPK
jgi:hypothetical protein